MAGPVNVKALAWGVAFAILGILVAIGNLPGLGNWGSGPRIGAATALIVFGLTILLVANALWFLRRTTKPEDYRGGCPVGATCGCGHFNFKPRRTCKQCGLATSFV